MKALRAVAAMTAAVVVLGGGLSNVEHPDFPKWLCDALPTSFCAIR